MGRYAGVLREALHTKQRYTKNTLSDIWNEVDVERRYRLPSSKVAALLEDDAFDEVPNPIELLRRMGVDDKGDQVSRNAFTKVVLEDGHVGQRSQEAPKCWKCSA